MKSIAHLRRPNPLLLALVVSIVLSIGAGVADAANDRPLLFGMNPTPMEWWGYDRDVWDPLLFQKMREAGCTVVRVGVNWDQIEKTPGVRDWSEIDRQIEFCLNNYMEPVILINSTPTWALPGDYDPNVVSAEGRYPPDEAYAEEFKQWVYDVVRRYRGACQYYEFWNEANGYGWYTALLNPPTYGRADLYTPWMIRAYKMVKLADPTALMSTTGIDDSGTGHAVDFLNGIYNYGGQGYFDAVADHPYNVGTGFQAWKMDLIRQRLDAQGDNHVDVWITEYGKDNPTDYFNALTQNQYDYVKIATWHTANEFPWEPGYGLMNKDLTPKPEYNAFKNYPKPARPSLTSLTIPALTSTSITIRYMTNMPATGMVFYGKHEPSATYQHYGNVTGRSETGTLHEHQIVGLKPGTTYNFRIRYGAVKYGDTFSNNVRITTRPGTAVAITSGPSVTSVTHNSAIVTWNTDVPATTRLDYGTDFNYGQTYNSTELTTQHSVALTGLEADKIYQFLARSSADGLAEGAKEGAGFRTAALPALLKNGSFEQGTANWTFWEVYPWGAGDPVSYPGHVSVYSDGGLFKPTPPNKDGAHRATLDLGYASGIGGIYQTIDAPNGTYLVGGWMATGTNNADTIHQIVAIDGEYQGGVPSGVVVGQATSSSPWQWYQKSINVTTGKLTVLLRASQYHAGLMAAHYDGISVVPVVEGNATVLKSAQVGARVVTDEPKIVTASLGSNSFYMQDQDRSGGIRVETVEQGSFVIGQRLNVSGYLAEDEGEAIIENATFATTGGGEPASPLGMNVRSIGGGAAGLQQPVGEGIGLNNTGLLINTWGTVVSSGADEFVLQDASGAQVLCRMLPATPSVPAVGSRVIVTGVSSCRLDGESLERMLYVRTNTDISSF